MYKQLFNLKSGELDLVPWPPTGIAAEMLDYVPHSQHVEFFALIRNGESIEDALIIATENALGLKNDQRTRYPRITAPPSATPAPPTPPPPPE